MKEVVKPGWRNRGYIPHFDANSVLQHIVLSALPGVSFVQAGLPLIIEDSLLNYDKKRYCLLAWCIMPDHLHIYLTFAPDQLLGTNVREWKSWITRLWNKEARRTGPIFSVDYFDRYARTLEHASKIADYIEFNPVTAGLVVEPAQWRWSSAWHKANGWSPNKDWLPVFLPPGGQ